MMCDKTGLDANRDCLISPSLFSADMLHLARELESIKKSGAKWVHLDVMDGHFVPNFFLSPKTISDIRRGTALFLDAHLMIDNPQKYLSHFIKAGCDAITIHYESSLDMKGCLTSIHESGCKAGIAIKPDTSLDLLIPFLYKVDLVLVMATPPGISGQRFRNEAYLRIGQLQKWRKEMKLNYLISVDGSVDDVTGPLCIKAGADVLVSGSFYFSKKERCDAVKDLLGG